MVGLARGSGLGETEAPQRRGAVAKTRVGAALSAVRASIVVPVVLNLGLVGFGSDLLFYYIFFFCKSFEYFKLLQGTIFWERDADSSTSQARCLATLFGKLRTMKILESLDSGFEGLQCSGVHEIHQVLLAYAYSYTKI